MFEPRIYRRQSEKDGTIVNGGGSKSEDKKTTQHIGHSPEGAYEGETPTEHHQIDPTFSGSSQGQIVHNNLQGAVKTKVDPTTGKTKIHVDTDTPTTHYPTNPQEVARQHFNQGDDSIEDQGGGTGATSTPASTTKEQDPEDTGKSIYEMSTEELYDYENKLQEHITNLKKSGIGVHTVNGQKVFKKAYTDYINELDTLHTNVQKQILRSQGVDAATGTASQMQETIGNYQNDANKRLQALNKETPETDEETELKSLEGTAKGLVAKGEEARDKEITRLDDTQAQTDSDIAQERRVAKTQHDTELEHIAREETTGMQYAEDDYQTNINAAQERAYTRYQQARRSMQQRGMTGSSDQLAMVGSVTSDLLTSTLNAQTSKSLRQVQIENGVTNSLIQSDSNYMSGRLNLLGDEVTSRMQTVTGVVKAIHDELANREFSVQESAQIEQVLGTLKAQDWQKQYQQFAANQSEDQTLLQSEMQKYTTELSSKLSSILGTNVQLASPTPYDQTPASSSSSWGSALATAGGTVLGAFLGGPVGATGLGAVAGALASQATKLNNYNNGGQ